MKIDSWTNKCSAQELNHQNQLSKIEKLQDLSDNAPHRYRVFLRNATQTYRTVFHVGDSRKHLLSERSHFRDNHRYHRIHSVYQRTDNQ